MNNFELTLDYSEIDFLQTSLEVILDRQLNSIAETNIWLKKNKKQLIALKEKIEAGKSGFFTNNEEQFKKLNKKREDVIWKLDLNKSVNRRARKMYLNILHLRYNDDERHLKRIKEGNQLLLKDDRERPFKDFHKKWEKTFF
jgi:ClpP class serine protease